MKKLEEPMRTAVTGALNRAVRNRRPRLAEIDWNRTIRANLRHYQEEYRTVIPEQLVGFGRKSRRSQRDVILAIDGDGVYRQIVAEGDVVQLEDTTVRTIAAFHPLGPVTASDTLFSGPGTEGRASALNDQGTLALRIDFLAGFSGVCPAPCA